MPVTISQQDYWDLVRKAQSKTSLNHEDRFDVTWQYPEELGQGNYREIQLRKGITLDIVRYHLQDDVIVQSPERSHAIEYNFAIAGKYTLSGKYLHNYSLATGKYELFGSGIASIESFCNLDYCNVNLIIKPYSIALKNNQVWLIIFI